MKPSYPVHWPQFFTATCYYWLPLLAHDKYKNIIVNSLQFMVKNKRIALNAFAIMSNHIHLILQVQPGYEPSAVQLSFMRYTAQQIKFELIKDDPGLLEKCKVNKADREYQIWKREPLGIDLFTLVFRRVSTHGLCGWQDSPFNRKKYCSVTRRVPQMALGILINYVLALLYFFQFNTPVVETRLKRSCI